MSPASRVIESPFLTTEQAAAYCGLSPDGLRKARSRGLVRGSLRGGRGNLVWERSDLDAFMGGVEQASRPVVRMPSRMEPPMEGGVYFVQCGGPSDNEPVKIGIARNVRLRLQELQIAQAHALVLRAIGHGRDEDEAACHARFAHLRLSGEWFRPGAELVEFISEIRRANGAIPGSEYARAIDSIRRLVGRERTST